MTDQLNVQRLENNPILRPNMDDRMGDNLNGPSLIKIPEWVPNPLGKYYLYFGHHDGKYVRLAYSDDLTGPWRIHTPGALALEESNFAGHIASPDVHIDNESQQIRMYFHGSDTASAKGGDQSTRVAVSTDGLAFRGQPELLGNPYLRAFVWNDRHYAIAMPGVFYRSEDGLSNFEQGPTPFTSNIRHAAVTVSGDLLKVFFTVIGDSPERIRLSTIKLSGDWMNWEASEPVDVLAPELPWEGSEMPIEPSMRGLVYGPVNQLRDPAIFHEGDRTYLLYSVSGESGIAIAELLD